MTNLKAGIGSIQQLVIVSNRHLSIRNTVANVFLKAFHALCIYHIRNNLMTKFKNKNIILHFYGATKAYKMCNFEIYWAKLQ